MLEPPDFSESLDFERLLELPNGVCGEPDRERLLVSPEAAFSKRYFRNHRKKIKINPDVIQLIQLRRIQTRFNFSLLSLRQTSICFLSLPAICSLFAGDL